jgi:DNA-binding SARP family transcriptional activator
MLEVRVLGQFDVRLNGNPVDLPSRPAQSLLAHLILTAGTPHRREHLAGLLWPDATEANARSNLRHTLWRIRKALGTESKTEREYLLADELVISFDPQAAYWLDAALLARSTKPAQTETLDGLIASVSVYGGELLPGFYEEWVILERERLKAAFERKMQKVLEGLVEERRWPEVLEWGERWIALGHTPEPAYRALMHAHSGLGDLSSVAAVFRRCSEALQRELGVGPSEQTLKAYQWLSSGGNPGTPKQTAAQTTEGESAVTAISALLKHWRKQKGGVLDLASLAIVHGSDEAVPLDHEDVALLIRSALHYGIDLEPWIKRAGCPEVAVAALEASLETYPRPQVRLSIVDALKSLDVEEAHQALIRIAANDDAPAVRAEAAVAAARRGGLETVAGQLAANFQATRDASALEALVAVADEVGLPENLGPYPKFPVALALAHRRWQMYKSSIVRQMILAAVGGALALALCGSASPFFIALSSPEMFQKNLNFVSLPAWMVSGAVTGIIWGSLQGAPEGFMVGLADALWRGKPHCRWRLVFGGLAGLVNSILLIIFMATGLFGSSAMPAVYILASILDGCLIGSASSLAVPPLRAYLSARRRWLQAIGASGIIALITVPFIYTVYPEGAGAALPFRLAWAALFPLGLAFMLSNSRRGVSLAPDPTTKLRNTP